MEAEEEAVNKLVTMSSNFNLLHPQTVQYNLRAKASTYLRAKALLTFGKEKNHLEENHEVYWNH